MHHDNCTNMFNVIRFPTQHVGTVHCRGGDLSEYALILLKLRNNSISRSFSKLMLDIRYYVQLSI